jgi:hypothetical protein
LKNAYGKSLILCKLASNEYFMPVMGLIFLRHTHDNDKLTREGICEAAEAIVGNSLLAPAVGQ